MVIWCLIWEQCPTASKELPMLVVPSTWGAETDDHEFEPSCCNPVRPQDEGRKEKEWDRGGGSIHMPQIWESCIPSGSFLLSHSLLSTFRGSEHLWLREASRLKRFWEWGCEGWIMTWWMASKASCGRKLHLQSVALFITLMQRAQMAQRLCVCCLERNSPVP